MTAFRNPSLEEIKQLLQDSRHIAVVGLSPKPNRPSYQVSKAMQDYGYHIIPVRPAMDEVLGEKAYADLRDVQGPIDLVDVFRNPSQIDPIVDACIELQVPALWLQDGVVNLAAAQRAQQAGIRVIMDRCIYRDYATLLRP